MRNPIMIIFPTENFFMINRYIIILQKYCSICSNTYQSNCDKCVYNIYCKRNMYDKSMYLKAYYSNTLKEKSAYNTY